MSIPEPVGLPFQIIMFIAAAVMIISLVRFWRIVKDKFARVLIVLGAVLMLIFVNVYRPILGYKYWNILIGLLGCAIYIAYGAKIMRESKDKGVV
jgi:hypothetical protein